MIQDTITNSDLTDIFLKASRSFLPTDRFRPVSPFRSHVWCSRLLQSKQISLLLFLHWLLCLPGGRSWRPCATSPSMRRSRTTVHCHGTHCLRWGMYRSSSGRSGCGRLLHGLRWRFWLSIKVLRDLGLRSVHRQAEPSSIHRKVLQLS